MNQLIHQLFEIAVNQEFTPDQRRDQMRIALEEYEAKSVPPTFMADAELGARLHKEPLPAGGIRFTLGTPKN